MSSTNPMRVKLKAVTFCLGETPGVNGVNSALDSLMWCNKVPKGKRNKPAKINGVQHHEIYTPWDADFRERMYYQPL